MDKQAMNAAREARKGTPELPEERIARELAVAQAEIARLRAALEAVIRNDGTTYRHNQPRYSDGAHPNTGDGTCWLTPRELAEAALSTPEDRARRAGT